MTNLQAAIDAAAAAVADVLADLDESLACQLQHATVTGDGDTLARIEAADPFHFAEQARARLREGFMLARRAVEQPSHF